jgi:uncharacterized iron-regulated membrane protein
VSGFSAEPGHAVVSRFSAEPGHAVVSGFSRTGTHMRIWKNWVQQPQRVWLRRAAFQIHLWTGLAIGLYIVVLSITGSVLVYRRELDVWLAAPRPTFDATAHKLTKEELAAAALRIYPDHTITRIGDRVTRRNPTVEIWLERGTDKKERLFNPYTGADLGDAVTQGELVLLWIARLHDELLFDRAGKYWNGALSGVMTILVLTGAIVWWPGVTRWKRSLGVKFTAGWKRINWDLHSAMGFWLFLFMLIWGVSGVYLGIPEPFSNFVDSISDPDAYLGDRPGDIVLMWLTRLHFGRWRNEPLRAVWAIVGLAPAVMFVTGAVMWWQRVIRPRMTRSSFDASVRRSARV